MQDQGCVIRTIIKRPITPFNHPSSSLLSFKKCWAIDFLKREDCKISKILKGVWVLRASGESNLLRGSLWFLLIASAATLGVFRFGTPLTIYTPQLIQEFFSKENATSQTGSPGGIPSSVGSPAMLVQVDLKWKETNQKYDMASCANTRLTRQPVGIRVSPKPNSAVKMIAI